jgi:hypothetical protein
MMIMVYFFPEDFVRLKRGISTAMNALNPGLRSILFDSDVVGETH